MNNKERGAKIRSQILMDLNQHPSDIGRHIGQIFSISPQAVHNHLKKLEHEGYVASSGKRKGKKYALGDIRENKLLFETSANRDEYTLWREHFAFVAQDINSNVYDICLYGFTEMINNVIDHSAGDGYIVSFKRTEKDLCISIIDFGEGIFKRIKRFCQLDDERESLLELSKGKFTTDPDNHSGEGIFFASRAFDEFFIDSKGLQFTHNHELDFDTLDAAEFDNGEDIGTHVYMKISRDSNRDLNDIYEAFGSGPDDYQFSKTIVPVRLAQYGDDKLVSRSQAKRLLVGLNKFENIVLDFEGVPSIGQAFADEIFRVYQSSHQNMTLAPVKMEAAVERMVQRVRVNPL